MSLSVHAKNIYIYIYTGATPKPVVKKRIRPFGLPARPTKKRKLTKPEPAQTATAAQPKAFTLAGHLAGNFATELGIPKASLLPPPPPPLGLLRRFLPQQYGPLPTWFDNPIGPSLTAQPGQVQLSRADKKRKKSTPRGWRTDIEVSEARAKSMQRQASAASSSSRGPQLEGQVAGALHTDPARHPKRPPPGTQGSCEFCGRVYEPDSAACQNGMCPECKLPLEVVVPTEGPYKAPKLI